jgi:hypothetical protein
MARILNRDQARVAPLTSFRLDSVNLLARAVVELVKGPPFIARLIIGFACSNTCERDVFFGLLDNVTPVAVYSRADLVSVSCRSRLIIKARDTSDLYPSWAF